MRSRSVQWLVRGALAAGIGAAIGACPIVDQCRKDESCYVAGPNDPAYTMAAVGTAAVSAGQSGVAVFIITPRNGFADPITISLNAGHAAWITAAAYTAPAGSTTIQFPFQVASGAPLGPGIFSVHTVSSSQTARDLTFDVSYTVVPVPSGISLSVQTAPLTVTSGTTSPADNVTVTRSNFTGAVILSGAGETGSGITVSVTTQPGSGAQGTFTVTVPPGLAPRTPPYQVTLTAQASGLTDVTTSFAVIVQAPPSNTTWTFCPVSGLPLWVAVQDGSIAWTQVTGSNNAYAFQISSTKGGIAYVILGGGVYQLHVFYGSQAELQIQGASLCPGSGAIKTINGSVSNTGTATNGFASLGSRLAVFSPPGTTTFQFRNVAPGTLDLVAATVDGASPPNPIKMLVRRNVSAVDGSTLPALDFAGSEAFAPVPTAVLTLANTLGQQVNLDGYLHSINNLQSLYYDDANAYTATSRTLFGVPAANQSAGDLHYWSALATSNVGSGAVPFRTQGVVFGSVAAKTLTFGSALDAPTISKPSGFVVRAAVPVRDEYKKLWQAQYDQVSNAGRLVTVQMTFGYLGTGPTTANIDLPDLSAAAGWNSIYGLLIGTPAAWKVTASSWSTAGGITFVQFIDGATFTSATAQGTITP